LRRCGGPKNRAKTDRADARLLRTLLLEGRFPESWMPPAQVIEVRTLGRLYCALMDERRCWQQRIDAQLFHQGCPPITALRSQAGREALAGAKLSAAGRQYVDTVQRRIDQLSAEIALLRAQLVAFARHQPGCQALETRHYGVGGYARRSSGLKSATHADWGSSMTANREPWRRVAYPRDPNPSASARTGCATVPLPI
jgi:hypothetical protein